jgi:peroxidase
LLLGKNTLDDYSGYDQTVNVGISNEFSTAAFRVGHTMLSTTLQNGTSEGLALRDSFFNPDLITTGGVDNLLLGLASQAAQEVDTLVIDDVRNFLFGQPGAGGFDLVSLNIQRGRDHGIPSYTEVREELGLDPITNFADISSDPEVQADLKAVYGSVDQVDLWVGGLAEDHVNGALVGETFQVILLDQFTRLRDGDRFYYENDQLLSVLAPDVENTTLGDIILANSSISNIQDNVFLV